MSYYTKREVTPVTDPPAWENTDNTVRNLLIGSELVSISSVAPIDGETATPRYNTPDTEPQLTDGVISDVYDFNDPRWFRFTRGTGRAVVFRLGGLSAVSGFRIGFLKQDSAAVRLPRGVDICCSENGTDWQRVYKCRDIYSDEYEARVCVGREFGFSCRALYVMVEFDVIQHVWVDEIEILGTTAVPDTARKVEGECLDKDELMRIVNAYPKFDDLCGIHNLLLAYNCIPRDKRTGDGRGEITYEEFLPHLAYYDKLGVMRDTFFDGFLFLPYSVFTYSKYYKCAEGWHDYIDNLFVPDRNVDALNRAAATVGSALSLRDYKVNVCFSVLHTKVRYGDHPDKFGDLDGDGADEDMESFEGRKKAIKWCIDETLSRFEAGNYENLTCGALYWFEEDVAYGDKLELPLIQWTADYLHSLGKKLFWIPYYQASGYGEWKDVGFDVACMQPNFAFRDGIPVQRLYDNADITKRLGMCYELEIGGSDPVNVERYMKYLDCGAETGFMHTIKMYYQGGVPGEFHKAFVSSDPELRKVYDSTYLFAKEKYVSRNTK